MPPKRQLTDSQRITRQRVRAIAGYDINRGNIPRQPCEICGAEPAECHHIDYNDPERVMWLCTAHHRQTHSQFARPAPLDWMADIRAAQRRIDAQRRAIARPAPDDSK